MYEQIQQNAEIHTNPSGIHHIPPDDPPVVACIKDKHIYTTTKELYTNIVRYLVFVLLLIISLFILK